VIPSRHSAIWLGLALLGAAAAMAVPGLVAAADAPLASLVLWNSSLPRAAVALLAGAALGLAGVLFQQALRNPLAEPGTLGVSGGAYLALAASSILIPGLPAWTREATALAGGLAAAALVFGLAWRQALAPMAVILAGLIVELICGALVASAALFGGAGFQSIFLWASGSLVQGGWPVATALALRLLVAGALAAALLRPLRLLDIGDEGAGALGMAVRRVRLLALAVAIGISASVVSMVGVIGFIGLAAPALARLAGARHLGARLIAAPLIGAALLWLADGAVQAIGTLREMPAGAATALFGAPLLLWLLPRLRPGAPPPRGAAAPPRRLRHPLAWVAAGLLLLALVVWLSLTVGRGVTGWQWRGWDAVQPLLFWRLPRLGAALSAGVMLAAAGCILQRLTGNPMASPEVLGVSAGAALGSILLLLLVPGFDRTTLLTAAALGALAAQGLLLWLGRRSGQAPEPMLLGGIALATVLGGTVAAFLASGDPRALIVAQWLSGTTYLVTPPLAWLSAGIALLLCPIALLAGRWLDILPLGDAAARGLGLRLAWARGLLLLLAALLTAAATVVVGPLSFVGLLAPHAARLLGLARAVPQILGALLIGAVIMVAADWLGRVLLFPAQMPAGLVATLIGTPCLLWLMRRR
jgi:iron complex transport system permease protein